MEKIFTYKIKANKLRNPEKLETQISNVALLLSTKYNCPKHLVYIFTNNTTIIICLNLGYNQSV